jgi:hypothetical protein
MQDVDTLIRAPESSMTFFVNRGENSVSTEQNHRTASMQALKVSCKAGSKVF